jgi:hydroxymethylpyrimidine/phosphomethylpyrimidine kinase
MRKQRPPTAMTIAGSDSGGGAGIQADLKTFTALGVFGTSAITALTAQNTRGVSGVHNVPPTFVAQQIDMVAQDIGVDAAKTGMLSTTAIIEAVADAIERNRIQKLVVDPVMIAKSGDPLLRPSARQALVKRLLPLAYIVTPNIPEAEVLSGRKITTHKDIEEAARRIHSLGPRYVLMKGGHLKSVKAVDYLFDGKSFRTYSAKWIATKNTHGTGCTFSAAIAAYLAKKYDLPEAVDHAKQYVTKAIQRSFNLGHGHGPLNHFWRLQWKCEL